MFLLDTDTVIYPFRPRLNRSKGARSVSTPRTISSSTRRAQSAASRWVRKGLMAIDQPVLRITAFQIGFRVSGNRGYGSPRVHFKSSVQDVYHAPNRLLTQKFQVAYYCLILAEREGFEPSWGGKAPNRFRVA